MFLKKKFSIEDEEKMKIIDFVKYYVIIYNVRYAKNNTQCILIYVATNLTDFGVRFDSHSGADSDLCDKTVYLGFPISRNSVLHAIFKTHLVITPCGSKVTFSLKIWS